MQTSKIKLLDGGLAIELERLGANTQSALWTAAAIDSDPDIIRNAHLAYFRAGSDIIISAGYQATVPGLMATGLSLESATRQIDRSNELAIEAKLQYQQESARNVEVAASIGPYGAYLADGSEYRGDYVLSITELKAFHRSRIESAIRYNMDYLAIETLPNYAEAQAFAELIDEFQYPCWISFQCRDAHHLADGTPLESAVSLFSGLATVVAIGANCVAADLAEALYEQFNQYSNKPVILYPNSGAKYDSESKSWNEQQTEEHYLSVMQSLYEKGALFIGGCCQIDHQRIAKLNTLITA